MPDPERLSSVTSRGKPTQPKFWRRVWKTGRFRRLQYGATLPLSTLNLGVESWIASLRATRASQTATPERCEARTTTDGCSTTFSGSSRACGLVVSSARTCRGTLTVNSPTSSRHWSEWVGALRQEYSARKRLDSVIAESDLSSWPTSQARDYKGVDRAEVDRGNMRPLNEVVAHWPTPMAADDGHKVTRNSKQKNLIDETARWPTPRTPSGGPESAERKKELGRLDAGGGDLQAAAEQWGTPTAVVRVRDDSTMAKSLEFRQSKGKTSVPLYLGEQVERWATPRATDGAKGSPNQAFGDGGGIPLSAQTHAWATPRSAMSKALGNEKHIGRPNTGNGNIEDQAAMWKTPDVPNGGRKLKKGTTATGITPDGDKRQVGLENQVGMWTTPTTDDSEGRKGKYAQGGTALAAQSDQWRTPTSLSGDRTPGNSRNANVNTTLANSLLGLPAHLIPDGPESSWLRRFVLRQYRILSSPKSPSWAKLRAWCVRSMRRKLSESFVEWMHGWPIGWTDSENAVTGFQVWLRRSRGELLKLVSVESIDRTLFD